MRSALLVAVLVTAVHALPLDGPTRRDLVKDIYDHDPIPGDPPAPFVAQGDASGMYTDELGLHNKNVLPNEGVSTATNMQFIPERPPGWNNNLAQGHVVIEPPSHNKNWKKRQVQPQCWNGTNFPAQADWVDFETLFNDNGQLMLNSNDTADEVAQIKTAFVKYAEQGGYDPRLALAITMRESGGLTTTPCGDAGKSCGLMQVQGPSGLQCSAHPCENIDYQIQCGTVGGCPGQTGSNIATCLSSYGNLPGAAARCYNTGSVPDPSDYTVATYGIRSYVQDIANILLGAEGWEIWGLDNQCHLS